LASVNEKIRAIAMKDDGAAAVDSILSVLQRTAKLLRSEPPPQPQQQWHSSQSQSRRNDINPNDDNNNNNKNNTLMKLLTLRQLAVEALSFFSLHPLVKVLICNWIYVSYCVVAGTNSE